MFNEIRRQVRSADGTQKSHRRSRAATFSRVTRSLRCLALSPLTRGNETSAACPHENSSRVLIADNVLDDVMSATATHSQDGNKTLQNDLQDRCHVFACPRQGGTSLFAQSQPSLSEQQIPGQLCNGWRLRTSYPILPMSHGGARSRHCRGTVGGRSGARGRHARSRRLSPTSLRCWRRTGTQDEEAEPMNLLFSRLNSSATGWSIGHRVAGYRPNLDPDRVDFAGSGWRWQCASVWPRQGAADSFSQAVIPWLRWCPTGSRWITGRPWRAMVIGMARDHQSAGSGRCVRRWP